MSVFVIAEAGVNHNGSVATALQLVDEAKKAGANAIKFQTFRADALVVEGTAKADYQKRSSSASDQLSMLRALELSEEAHAQIARRCADVGIEFMSTGFDEESMDMLVNLGIKRIKIPSGEITNFPYISYLIDKKLPIILSTGMANLQEVREVVQFIDSERKKRKISTSIEDLITILHCTSNYPAKLDSLNLRALTTISNEFGLSVGYSDHSSGILIAPLAVAMGATVIEKHFTLDRNMDGPDHLASLEPDELRQMIENIRATEIALGSREKSPTKSELGIRKLVRRSIVANKDLCNGEKIGPESLAVMRPAGGIEPRHFEKLVGMTLARDIRSGTQIRWEDLVK